MTELHQGQHFAVAVSTPSRTHWGLLDCGYASDRLFGGVGAAIDGFRTDVQAALVEEGEAGIVYNPTAELDPMLHMSDRTCDELDEIVGRFNAHMQDNLVRLTVSQTAPEHMGLGSKTSLEMATVYALGTLLLASDASEH